MLDDLDPLHIQFLIDNPQVLEQLRQTEGAFDGTTNRIERRARQAGGAIENLAKQAAVAAASYFSIQAVKNFVTNLVEVRGQFEQLQVAYTTILGSKKKADELFAQTVKLAQTTPFSLMEVANSTKQLLAYGFSAEEVTGTLSKLGDVAAGVSAPIGEIAYLYGTLKTQGRAYAQDIRQFTGRGIPIIKELAAQFNTTSENVNKLVEAGMVGFPEIEKAFNSLTGRGGQFFNLMQEQSKTVTGQISNLGDAFDQMLNDLGKSNEDIIKGGIGAASALVSNYQKVLDIIEQIIITYGAYKAAVMTVTALQSLQASRTIIENVQRFNGATMVTVQVTRELTVAQTLQAGAANIAGKAQEFLNATMLSNPYVALTVGIAAMAAAMYTSAKQTDYAAKASEAYHEALTKEEFKLGSLFQALESTKAGTEERKKAINGIKDAYGEYLPKMDLEKANLEDIRKAYSEVNSKISENISLKAKADQTQSQNEDFTKRYSKIVKNLTDEVANRFGDAQAGRASAIIGQLIAQAQQGKIFLGAGNRGKYEGGSELLMQAQKYAEQLQGTKGGDIYLSEYLNQLQTVVDEQRRAKAALDAFYKGVNEVTTTGNKELSEAQKKAIAFQNLLKPGQNGLGAVDNFKKLMGLETGRADLKSIADALDKALDVPNIARDKIEQIKAMQGQVKKALDVYSRDVDKKLTEQQESEQQRRNAIFDKIGKLNETALEDTKTQDQKEVMQARAKYDELLKLIDRFNNDKKNKTKIDPKNIRINGVSTNLVSAADGAADTVTATQAFQKEKELFEAQKEVYVAYEKYKNEVGAEMANERFGSELKGYTDFVGYLQGLMDSVAGKTDKRSVLLQDYLKTALPAARNQAFKDDQEQLSAMLNQLMTFEQRAKIIIEKAQTDAYKLRKAGKEREADLRLAQGVDELNQQNEQSRQTVDGYRDLAQSIETLTKEQAEARIQAAIATAQADLNAAKISEDAFNKIVKYIKQAQGVVSNNVIVQNLDAISASLMTISDSLSGLSGNAASVIGSIGTAIKQVADLSHNIEKMKTSIQNYGNRKDTSFLGSVSAITDMIPVAGAIIGGVIKGISAVVGFFKAAKESAIKAAAEMLAYQQSLIVGEVKYNELLRERERSQQNITDLTITELKTRQVMLAQEKQQATADYNRILALIQTAGQQITGEHTEKYGGFLGIGQKTKVVQDLAGLSSADYTTLEKLYTQGKLTDTTRAWFEELQKVKGELDTIGTSAQDAVDQLAKVATGTTSNDIANAIIDGFKQGKRSAADFADDFQSLMQNAALSAFQNEYLNAKIAEFYKQFTAAAESDGGLSAAKIADLKAAYAKAINDAGAAFSNLEKVTGTSLTTGESSNSLSGAIKGISAEQADLLAGQFGGLRVAQLEGNSIQKQVAFSMKDQLLEMKQHTISLIKIEANTKRTADNTDSLVDVANSLASIDKKMSANSNALAANGRLP